MCCDSTAEKMWRAHRIERRPVGWDGTSQGRSGLHGAGGGVKGRSPSILGAMVVILLLGLFFLFFWMKGETMRGF